VGLAEAEAIVAAEPANEQIYKNPHLHQAVYPDAARL
jgi:hypothetical protein